MSVIIADPHRGFRLEAGRQPARAIPVDCEGNRPGRAKISV